jgi:hypothetical protein
MESAAAKQAGTTRSSRVAGILEVGIFKAGLLG